MGRAEGAGHRSGNENRRRRPRRGAIHRPTGSDSGGAGPRPREAGTAPAPSPLGWLPGSDGTARHVALQTRIRGPLSPGAAVGSAEWRPGPGHPADREDSRSARHSCARPPSMQLGGTRRVRPGGKLPSRARKRQQRQGRGERSDIGRTAQFCCPSPESGCGEHSKFPDWFGAQLAVSQAGSPPPFRTVGQMELQELTRRRGRAVTGFQPARSKWGSTQGDWRFGTGPHNHSTPRATKQGRGQSRLSQQTRTVTCSAPHPTPGEAGEPWTGRNEP